MDAGAAGKAEAPRPLGALAVGFGVGIVRNRTENADHRHVEGLGGEGHQPLGQLQALVVRDRARLQGKVLAAQHHGDHARAVLGDVVDLRQRARMLDHRAEADRARFQTALLLEIGHDFVEQLQVLHALGLGDEQRRDAGLHRGLEIGDRHAQRPVDAHRHVGAAARHFLDRVRQHGARVGLLRRLHAVLEIDQHAIGAALVRLVDELRHIAWHVEDRAPDGIGGTRYRHFFLPFEITPD